MSEPTRLSFNLEYNPPPRASENAEENSAPNGIPQEFEEELQQNNDNNMEEEIDDATPVNNNNPNLDPAALDELERDFKITHDPDTGAKLVELYKNNEDFENVRRIRELILEHSMLSEKDWLDWIDDEINTAKTDEEKKGVLKLIDRALDESLFFDVAKLGINYVKGLYNNGIVKKQGVKITMEKIINAFIFDFNVGSKFFKKLRKFELGNTEVKNENDREKTIRNLYERQLKLPYADIQQTMNSYYDWEKNEEERKRIIKIYEETYKKLGVHLDFEDKFQEMLDGSDADGLREAFEEIVDSEDLSLEKKLNFFERYIALKPMEPVVWEKYCEFADANLQSASALERIYRRANKTCPGNINFTKSYLRVLERNGTEPEKLKEKIISMLWNFRTSADFYFLRLQLCEVYVRLLNAKLAENRGNISEAKEEIIRFRQAIQEGIQFFSSDLSPEHQAYIAELWLFKAHIETYTIKDKQQMNQSMDKYVQSHGSQYLAWNQYVTFEQALGRPDTVRKILKRGCEYTKDDIAAMFNLAINFERRFGSLEELQNTEKRFKEKKEKLAQEDANNLAAMTSEHNEPRKVDVKKGKGKKEKEGTGKRRMDNRNQGNEEQMKEVRHETKQVKKTKEQGEEKRGMEEEKKVEDNEESHKEDKKQESKLKEISYPEELDKKNTVFVKNFPVSFTGDDLCAVFVNANKITGCRFGKTKGTAYIDFATPEDALEACETNISIDGQKLKVALSAPPKKGSDDKKTLYLNNLPFEITDETLRETFKQWKNHIVEVRIPTNDSNNKARGYAYIVLDSEQVSNEIIDQNKDLHIGGRKIHIEHADSNKRYQDQNIKALHVAFITNLDFKVKESDLKEFFADFNVKEIFLTKDKKQFPIAFVEFLTLDDLKRAISIPEPKILGRQMVISKSNRPITKHHEPTAQEARPKKNSLSRKDVQMTEEQAPSAAATIKPSFPVPTQIKKPVSFVAAKGANNNGNNNPAPANNPPTAAPATTATTTNSAGMKSNNDFKALLFKKK